jgi:hypothetical protein
VTALERFHLFLLVGYFVFGGGTCIRPSAFPPLALTAH